jgi:hypothetical protein
MAERERNRGRTHKRGLKKAGKLSYRWRYHLYFGAPSREYVDSEANGALCEKRDFQSPTEPPTSPTPAFIHKRVLVRN